jgi:quercetin dioxygenase-like cupin family protein
MSNRALHFNAALAATVVGLVTAAHAVDLNTSAVTYMTPDQFKWTATGPGVERALLAGDPDKPGSLYVYINRFKPGRFGVAHSHPNDRYITVIEGAGWRGTGNVVDPLHAARLPKGSFAIDHANKVHWDGTKDETAAYLIAGIGPATSTPMGKTDAAWNGGDPGALTLLTPDQIQWKDNGNNKTVTLAGDPTKEGGMYVQMLTWKKGNGSRPHFHPNDRYFLVLDGTWWVGTGTKWDPANLTVPMRAGTFVTHLAKGVHWDGANGPDQDADCTIIVFGMSPATNIPAPGIN